MIDYADIKEGEILIFTSDTPRRYISKGDEVTVEKVWPNMVYTRTKKGRILTFSMRPGAKKLSKRPLKEETT